MALWSGLALGLALVWLSWPPRDQQRWALLSALGLTMLWLMAVALSRGVAAEFGSRGPLWLFTLALLGAPLIQLLVWSAVALVARPKAPHPPAPPEEETP